MTIWIIAILLIGVFGLVGYFLGAIRSILVFLGVLMGGVLALPLGPSLRPLFVTCGVTNTVWLWIWPPVAVFGLVALIFLGLSFAAHYPVAKHFKFATDDIGFNRWLRMNRRLGACVSVVSAVLTLGFFSAAIYGPGYLSVQVSKEEGEPFWLSFINKARQDLPSTGLDRVGAAWDPMPKKFYPVADILGLLYHNLPGIRDRLAEYPPFLSFGERQEFADMAGDKEFMDAVSGKASLVELIGNGRLMGIVNNPEIIAELNKLDLNDFRSFLDKGKTAKYDPLKILGRWEMDPDPMVSAIRKVRTDLTPAELTAIRSLASMIASNTKLKVTTDNKFALAMRGSFLDLQKVSVPKENATTTIRGAANPGAVAPGEPRQGLGNMSGMSAQMRRRYGLAPASQKAQPQDAAPAEGEEGEAKPVKPVSPLDKMETKLLQGSWDGEGENYQFTMRDASGKEETADVHVELDTITFTAMGQLFVFYRQ